MKKIIIPRKDHEVYFIRVPGKTGKIKNRFHINSELEKLHPALSVSSCVDIQKFYIDRTPWFMVTVMEESILTEYRLLYKNSVFYTNTSVLINKKQFINNGIIAIDDENIGYDAGEKIPISYQTEKKETETRHFSGNDLKKIPSAHGVYKEKKAPKLAAGFLLITAIMFFTLSFMANKVKNVPIITDIEPITEMSPELPEVPEYLPACTEILVKIAADIFKFGGKILQWQYNEERDPLILLQVQGINVSAVHKVFNQYDYLELQDIQEVIYYNDEPCITVCLNLNRLKYSLYPAGSYAFQNTIIPVFSSLINSLKMFDIAIISESLPALPNNYNYYRIAYTSKDWNLIKSLELFSEYCSNNQLWISKMDISFDREKNLFSVSCNFARCIDEIKITAAGNEKYYIPMAFGYSLKQEKEELQETEILNMASELKIIGSIRDNNSGVLFYHDNENGKIQVREFYEK